VPIQLPVFIITGLNIQIWSLNTLACPFFMPLEKLEGGAWPHPARLPLGAGWRGHCTAPGHEGETPSQDVLESFCNLGYASGCAWVPCKRAWDAVRFAVCAPQNGNGRMNQSADGNTLCSIRLRYACERDHWPVSDGELEFDVAHGSWLKRHDDPRLQRMAECFLDMYLKKKT
jgi:hypothetical protein